MFANVHRGKISTNVLAMQCQRGSFFWHRGAMDTQTRKIVAANVRRLRKQADMNQTVLAQKADLGQTTISSLEQPEGKSPTLDILTAVAGAFGVPVWTLLIDMDDSPPDRMRALDVVVRAYTHIPADGQRQIERVAEAEQRYAKAS